MIDYWQNHCKLTAKTLFHQSQQKNFTKGGLHEWTWSINNEPPMVVHQATHQTITLHPFRPRPILADSANTKINYRGMGGTNPTPSSIKACGHPVGSGQFSSRSWLGTTRRDRKIFGVLTCGAGWSVGGFWFLSNIFDGLLE